MDRHPCCLYRRHYAEEVKAQDTQRTKTFPCTGKVKTWVGVDLSGQLLQFYTAQHKTMKVWDIH